MLSRDPKVVRQAREILAFQLLRDELKHQCMLILEGVRILRMSSETESMRWFAIQGILGAMAVASHVVQLKPAPRSHFPRARERLRTAYDITDESAIVDRRLRDHFLHVDSKVEAWALDEERKAAAFRVITGNPLEMLIEGLGGELFEFYDPETTLVKFWDEEIYLTEVESEATRILEIMSSESRISETTTQIKEPIANGSGDSETPRSEHE